MDDINEVGDLLHPAVQKHIVKACLDGIVDVASILKIDPEITKYKLFNFMKEFTDFLTDKGIISPAVNANTAHRLHNRPIPWMALHLYGTNGAHGIDMNIIVLRQIFITQGHSGSADENIVYWNDLVDSFQSKYEG